VPSRTHLKDFAALYNNRDAHRDRSGAGGPTPAPARMNELSSATVASYMLAPQAITLVILFLPACESLRLSSTKLAVGTS